MGISFERGKRRDSPVEFIVISEIDGRDTVVRVATDADRERHADAYGEFNPEWAEARRLASVKRVARKTIKAVKG